jgi:hypothetical protein
MFLLKSRNGQHQLKLETIKQRNVQWSSEKWTHGPILTLVEQSGKCGTKCKLHPSLHTQMDSIN